MSKNTPRWMAVSALMLSGILVFSGCWWKGDKEGQETGGDEAAVTEPVESTQKTEEELRKEAFEADTKVLQTAVTKGDIEACQTIQNEILKASCTETATITKAKAEQNPALCESLTNEDLKTKCQEKASE